MNEMPFLSNLQEAEKKLQTASHMTHVTYPLIKDKKILLKIIVEIQESLAKIINSILQYEYFFKRINLSQDPKTNLETFRDKSAPLYKITRGEIEKILELFDLVRNHKKAPMEFVRNEKVVILSEDMRQRIVTLEKTKEFLILSASILEKTKSQWNIE